MTESKGSKDNQDRSRAPGIRSDLIWGYPTARGKSLPFVLLFDEADVLPETRINDLPGHAFLERMDAMLGLKKPEATDRDAPH